MNQTPKPYAIAQLHGSPDYPALYGTVVFHPFRTGVLVSAELFHLPEQKSGCDIFAFHIHEGHSCRGTSTDPFGDSGGHYNPTGRLHPCHAGDLPPLFGCHGYAYLSVFTDRFTLDEIIGRVVIVHSNPDDFTTDPSGNAGSKIACGVIRRGKPRSA